VRSLNVRHAYPHQSDICMTVASAFLSMLPAFRSAPHGGRVAAVYQDGRVCISILHSPGDDPHGYEKAEERWQPIHTVRFAVRVSVTGFWQCTGSIAACGLLRLMPACAAA
jgi:hypothetical protein